MNNIAITGSFASGKSFVLTCVKSMGYKVFSCDDYVKDLYQNPEIQKLVQNSIKGLDVFNKQNLAKIIYNNDEARLKLENIIHPKVRLAIKEFEKKNIEEEIIFTEVPLLFESGFDKNFKYSICVFCTEDTRISRAKARGILSDEIFEKIKAIQISQEEKKKRADFIIDSEKEIDEIKNKLLEIVKIVKFKNKLK